MRISILIGRYKVVKTMGSSREPSEIDHLVSEANRYAQSQMGLQEIDFTDHKKVFTDGHI